jgi:hypothetical protein
MAASTFRPSVPCSSVPAAGAYGADRPALLDLDHPRSQRLVARGARIDEELASDFGTCGIEQLALDAHIGIATRAWHA